MLLHLWAVAGSGNGQSSGRRTMAKTYEGLATLARETADATAAAAVTRRHLSKKNRSKLKAVGCEVFHPCILEM